MSFTRNLLLVLSITLMVTDIFAQSTNLPYYCKFETKEDTTGWKFSGVPGVATEWSWGQAESRSEGRSLYVSADGGTTAGYTECLGGYYIVAYKKFSVKAMQSYDLAFDCKVGGQRATDGTLDDGMTVAWIPASKGEPATGIGGALFPAYARQYAVTSDYGQKEFANTVWSNVTATVNAFETEYYLTFVWKANGTDVKGIGACIDNVQLGLQRKGECAAKPTNMKVVSSEDKSEFTVSWSGTAEKYDLQYYSIGTKKTQIKQDVKGLTANSYTIKLGTVPEGVYSVLVRSICGADTSIWSEVSNAFIYDASAHCVDYINLESEDVVCTWGIFDNPYSNTGVVDYGYGSAKSCHTVHYLQDEYDPRTNYMLRTVPEGAVASVRISNWQEQPAGSASISYKYHVTEDADVLKVRYAAVLQYAEHHASEHQTRIIVELFDDKADTLLSECTYSDFNAKDVDTDLIRGWHEFSHKDQPVGLLKEARPIKWCDWSVIGINLKDYIGMDLRIRYTLKACGADFHFAYAYLMLDCGKSEIEGISCGEHPNVFRVPEGFLYRWYELKKPEKTVCTLDSLVIQPTDTAKYGVDLIFPENEQCYFTLTASALPRRPEADMSYEVIPDNCQNRVILKNQSKIFGYWEGDIIETDEKCKVADWDLKDYGSSDKFDTEIIVPAHGDTFDISLTVAMDKNMSCIDTKTFRIEVPSIVSDTTFIHYMICEGISVEHDGDTYNKSERVELDYKNRFGCDSIVVLDITVINVEKVVMADTICGGESIDFYGRQLTKTGHYEDTVKSVFGCDSIIRQLDLVVRKPLDVHLQSDNVSVCADYGSFSITYENFADNIETYSISYDEAARSAGFEDSDIMKTDCDTSITVPMPPGILPARYNAVITFYNDTCGNLDIPITVSVLYPSSVIVQRWNDVLALQNSDYNGGYEFSSYQWFKNGMPIDGEISSVLYRPSDMDYTARYSMLLTRIADGVSAFTCDITPVEFSKEEIDDMPGIIIISEGEVALYANSRGMMYIYRIDGQPVCSVNLAAGDNNIRIPSGSGVFIIKIIYDDGKTECHKIMIR